MERIIYPYLFMFVVGGWITLAAQLAYTRQKITRWDARFRQVIALGTTILFCLPVAIAVYFRVSIFIVLVLLFIFCWLPSS